MSKKKKKSEIKNNRGSFFFAYQSVEKTGNCDNVDAINKLAKHLGDKAITWEKMKINGKIINLQILAAIEKAESFACDITYLNANVFFELGYAIGKKKPLFIMLNPKVKEAKSNYEAISILKGIGYIEYNNTEDLKRNISEFDTNHILLNELNLLSNNNCKNQIDIFYIKSNANSQAELDTISFIKESNYSQICDDKSEIPYQPLDWYLDSLNRCKYLIIHLSSNDKIEAHIDCCVNSLYAGLGYALNKKVLLVAPKPYFAPIDYNDILIQYKSSEECVKRIENWLPRKKIKKTTPSQGDKELNLLRLGIGYSLAEDEKDALSSYFVETYAYEAALKNKKSIFYGRKGTGKTALYIMLFNHFYNVKNTYLLGLKPESTDLLDNIEVVKLFEGTINKKSILHAIWKYVLYSKLLISIYENIKDVKKCEYNSTEQGVIDYYMKNSEMLHLNFLGVIKRLYEVGIKDNLSLTVVIEKYNKDFLSQLIMLIKNYFGNTKYYNIAILADNLDKAWDSNSDLSLQSEMLLSLLEISGKITQELFDKKKEKIEACLIMFLRSDIYKFILEKSREPDKVTIISNEVEWKSCRELLKRVVEKRLLYILELTKEDIPAIWKEYFDFGKDNPFDKVESACLPRPRDIIFFFGKMFESACNNSHTKVENNDFIYAYDSYTNFLYQNLVAEMSAEYPYIRDMIAELHSKFTDLIEINKFRRIVIKYEPDYKKSELLIKELFSNQYLLAVCEKKCEQYTDYDDVLLAEETEKKARKFFKRRVFHISQHPRYSRIKIK